MKILIFSFLIISSLFWHVFCFNESKNETLDQRCPDFPAGQLTYLFWEAGSKARVAIPSLDLVHAYYVSNCTFTHTVETGFGKELGLLHTPKSTATNKDTQTHADILSVHQGLRTSWEGWNWQQAATTRVINVYLDKEQDELCQQG